jgi:hypothetical protein
VKGWRCVSADTSAARDAPGDHERYAPIEPGPGLRALTCRRVCAQMSGAQREPLETGDVRSGPQPADIHHTSQRRSMKIHNLYVDDKGESHWRDIEVEYTESGRGGKLSPRLPATGIIFREVPPDYDLDWHPAPRRQYIINLDAGVEITASDGQKRRIGAGEVVLVEDTWGKGHLSKAVDGKLRNCIFVPVE